MSGSVQSSENRAMGKTGSASSLLVAVQWWSRDKWIEEACKVVKNSYCDDKDDVSSVQWRKSLGHRVRGRSWLQRWVEIWWMSRKSLVGGDVWVKSIPEIPDILERGNSTDESQWWEEHGKKLVALEHKEQEEAHLETRPQRWAGTSRVGMCELC